MRKPLLLLPLAALALALPSLAPSAREQLKQPSVLNLGASGAIHDTILRSDRRTLAQPAQDFWGGTYTTTTNEQVKVFASRTAYPEDQATGLKWANFLASLVHGPELSSVTIFLESPSEIRTTCGDSALACYSPGRESIYTIGTDPPLPNVTAEAVLTHEYGHHVASHRVNDPWEAVDWGTKRWASYENVCSRTRAKELWPGAENAQHYMKNPGEGFAETYRVLNQRKLGVPEMPWQIVTMSLYPNATALSLVQQDVLQPWTGPTTRTLTGTVRARETRSVVVKTPLDGMFRAQVAGRGKFKLGVFAPSGRRLASGGTSAATTVCGQRALRVRIGAQKTASYRLTVSRP